MNGEKMYLVCVTCGEAFDDIAIAYGHAEDGTPEYRIEPEEVAL